MDELEIAGKQYISTRRAGREHGYHSDYIGQLIRGKKVQGQKVGRSWYVDAESLATYLGKGFVSTIKTGTVTPMPVAEEPVAVVKEKKVVEEVLVMKEEPVVVATQEIQATVVRPEPEVAKSIAVEEKKIAQDVAEERVVPLHTPVRVIAEENISTATPAGGLVYMQDDAPSLPQVHTHVNSEYEVTSMAKAAVEYAPRSLSLYGTVFALISLLGLALVIGMGAATYLSLNVQVVGQTATSYYGITK